MDIQEAIRQEQREYQKSWRKANPEKVKAIRARYWKRKAEKRLAAQGAHNEQ